VIEYDDAPAAAERRKRVRQENAKIQTKSGREADLFSEKIAMTGSASPFRKSSRECCSFKTNPLGRPLIRLADGPRSAREVT